jgi:hypothetical protein
MTKFISIDKDTQEKKETVFTHLIDNEFKVIKPYLQPKDYSYVEYLRYSNYYKKDMFLAYQIGSDHSAFYIGTKGDEFN